MPRLVLSLVLALGITASAPAAAADTGGSANTDGGGITSQVGSGAGQPGSAATQAPVCVYVPVDIPAGITVYDEDGQPVVTDSSGLWFEKTCDGVFIGSVFVSRRNPAELLSEARRYLPLPLPEPALNPGGDQIVNLATWMWISTGWSTQRSSVSVPGISVNVTAEPVSATWSMGDGSVVVCDGPGVAYDPSLTSDVQAPTCAHTYTRSSASQSGDAYSVSVTLRWHATWEVIGFAGGGDLGMIDRTTALNLRVAELQAVNTPAS
jgi:hypothetical protein